MHYPTCADPLAPTWEDDHGSITGPSVHRGFSVYTDQVLLISSLPACTLALIKVARNCLNWFRCRLTFLTWHAGGSKTQGYGAPTVEQRPAGVRPPARASHARSSPGHACMAACADSVPISAVAAAQGIIGMRALSSLSTLRTNGYPLILVSGEQDEHFRIRPHHACGRGHGYL